MKRRVSFERISDKPISRAPSNESLHELLSNNENAKQWKQMEKLGNSTQLMPQAQKTDRTSYLQQLIQD